MAKAKKLNSGSWRVQVFSHFEYKDGKKLKRQRSFTASTKAEAERLAAQFAADRSRHAAGSYTVGEAVHEYITSKEPVLSPSTVRGYLVIEKQIDMIRGIRIDDLTSADLQHWISTLSCQMAPKSVKNAYSLVSAAIGLYSDRIYRVTLPVRQPVRYDIPTDDDVRRLMDEAGEELRLAIALAAIGTLRRGEICGLKRKDVMRDFCAVYVHTDVVLDKDKNWIHKEMPKTSDSVRRVPLPPEIIDMIACGDPEEYVVDMTPAALSDRFGRLRNRLGLKCRFHDLRHYAVSILHAIGIPDQYLMERGGWSNDGTLKAVYRNTLSDKSKAFSDRANDYFQQKFFRRSK